MSPYNEDNDKFLMMLDGVGFSRPLLLTLLSTEYKLDTTMGNQLN